MSRHSFHRTADGSVLNEDGKILCFSIERFARDICEGSNCFICGASPSDAPFNNEHIFPQWLLRNFKLHKRQITLPNLSGFRYDQYIIPCCERCNSLMSDLIETPISRLISQGYSAVADYLRSNGPVLFFTWFALLFIKTHLKDRTLRWHRDVRKGLAHIADVYKWEQLHHIHCIARAFYSRPIIDQAVIGSLVMIPARIAPHYEPFDYVDLYHARSLMLRLDDMCFIVILDDASGVLSLFHNDLRRITGPLIHIQMRELFTRYAYANLKLKDNPEFMSLFDPEQGYRIVAKHKEKVELRGTNLAQFGAILYRVTSPILDHMLHPDIDTIREKVKKGHLTFLYDDNGKFIEEWVHDFREGRKGPSPVRRGNAKRKRRGKGVRLILPTFGGHSKRGY